MKFKDALSYLAEAREFSVVKDIPKEYQFISNDTDVKEINKMYRTDYDSFFVIVGEGDYDSVYGMEGIVPDLDKAVYKVK